jgi:hypothetical protein
VEIFKLMIGKYRQDYDRARTEGDRQKLRESFENPETWAVLFREGSPDDDLLQRLEWAGDGHALRAAAALKAWLSAPKAASTLPCFDETLRNVILEVRPWQPHFQGSSP